MNSIVRWLQCVHKVDDEVVRSNVCVVCKQGAILRCVCGRELWQVKLLNSNELEADAVPIEKRLDVFALGDDRSLFHASADMTLCERSL